MLLTFMSAGVSVAQDGAGFPYISDLTNPDADTRVSKDQIRETQELVSPFTHAVTFHGRDGVAYMSQNGRFVMRGVIFDTWIGETIQTMDDLQASMKNVNLADLGLKDEDVDPFYYGHGPRKVTMFVDPFCPYCGQLFDELVSDPSYQEDYTFTIMTVPFLGDNSTRAVNALSCSQDRDAAIEALLHKNSRWMMAAQIPENCDIQPVLQRTILSQMLGVTGVPYIIGAEGGVSRGMPPSLRTFLATN
ncbi:DsbC family protein [Paracoccus sp. 1_MG-2023]|uniref:DsbC family protein n=1 Tax=unclassified Paracoccus (in: a-proteobacteria) TaxID=2688777 RepID=UPI001C0A23B0|nr:MULTISPECIES: DsbC family protein [unclassified Paracoccus (in: a-proteobacteria)]MBU2959152.1 DsbC family protein [Paracoccus sp. C2R09]MDO6669435.1 DsbC family protein [Paracoccus sp. 1_MG-2023]